MRTFLSILLLVVSAATLYAQEDYSAWFAGRHWLGSSALQPHPSINQATFFKQFQARPDWWRKALAFLERKDLHTLEPGRHSIVGDDVFASITYGPAKDSADTRWEAHRNYTDLQYVADGAELIGIAVTDDAAVTIPYDASRDIGFFEARGKYYKATPGTFFIFFPADLHRPGNKVDEMPVRKIVVKVRVVD